MRNCSHLHLYVLVHIKTKSQKVHYDLTGTTAVGGRLILKNKTLSSEFHGHHQVREKTILMDHHNVVKWGIIIEVNKKG